MVRSVILDEPSKKSPQHRPCAPGAHNGCNARVGSSKRKLTSLSSASNEPACRWILRPIPLRELLSEEVTQFPHRRALNSEGACDKKMTLASDNEALPPCQI